MNPQEVWYSNSVEPPTAVEPSSAAAPAVAPMAPAAPQAASRSVGAVWEQVREEDQPVRRLCFEEEQPHKNTFIFGAMQINSTKGIKWNEVMIDSGAGAHVCPLEYGQDYPVKPLPDQFRLVNANGSPIKTFGERWIKI